MHLSPRINGMLDFICMGPVDLPGAHRKQRNTKWKSLAHSGTRTLYLQTCSLMLYRLSCPGFDESLPIKVTFIHTCTSYTNVYIGIRSRMLNKSVFCLVCELCFIYWNISLLDKWEYKKRLMLRFIHHFNRI